MNLARPFITLSIALTFTAACLMMTGCKDESAPVAHKAATAAAHDDHSDHTGHDHDHAPAAKSAMGTVTGGVPAEITLVNTICPVSGEAFDRNDKTLSSFEHDGKHYGVCCSDCIALFKKNPEKYLAKLEAAQKALDTGKETLEESKSKATDALKSVTQ